MTIKLPDDETRGVELPDASLRVYNAFVAVEYDFQVIARSEAEALEFARNTWAYSMSKVAIAHAEVELSEEALDSSDLE